MNGTACAARATIVMLGLFLLACGEPADPVAPPDAPEDLSASAEGGTTPSRDGRRDLDDLERRAERAFAALDDSPRTIRGQVGGPIDIPSGLPRDLPLPVGATALSPDDAADGGGEVQGDVLRLAVDHPLDETRGFFRAALRSRGFEIVTDERDAGGFELQARRPSHVLLISGQAQDDETRVSISTPRG